MLADALGDPDAARRALTAAVLAAEPDGVVRPFLDAAPPLAALSGLPPRAQGFVAALLACRPGPVRRNGLSVEPLTTREVEVLRLLVAGRSNASIAATLFVELSTVKTHLIHAADRRTPRGGAVTTRRGLHPSRLNGGSVNCQVGWKVRPLARAHRRRMLDA